ncbi:uncharacterized protein LOC106671727 isoform X2 [Cimex lectularius]|uniref:PWWP domain-containing protein n=1 Tax=Cimex lectularius TaxID=79782 RepID=A0A8I6TJY4_CIMLE|nr:uncharacterized protein LOC106671727 isoform X2 [Cimex lectularius]
MAQQFSVGEIVFAKIKGYRPWPAVISYVSTQSNGKINYHVVFYGTGNSSVVGSRKIWKICDKMAVMGNPRKCKRFAAAIKDMIASLELEDPYDTNETLRKINDIRKKPTPRRELNSTSLSLSLSSSMTLAGSSSSISRPSAPFHEKFSFKTMPLTTGSTFAVKSLEVNRQMSKCIPFKKRIIANLLFDPVETELRQIQESEKNETEAHQLHGPSSSFDAGKILGQTIEEILTDMYGNVGKSKQEPLSNLANEVQKSHKDKIIRKSLNSISSSNQGLTRKVMRTAHTQIKGNKESKTKTGQNSFLLTINDTHKERRIEVQESYANKCYSAFNRQATTEPLVKKTWVKSVCNENIKKNKMYKTIEGSSNNQNLPNSIDMIAKFKGCPCGNNFKIFKFYFGFVFVFSSCVVTEIKGHQSLEECRMSPKEGQKSSLACVSDINETVCNRKNCF